MVINDPWDSLQEFWTNPVNFECYLRKFKRFLAEAVARSQLAKAGGTGMVTMRTLSRRAHIQVRQFIARAEIL